MALAALLVLSAGFAGCKSGGQTTPADGGSQIDRPGGDGSQMCPTTGTGAKPNGQDCACGNECTSGFCVDGFCCNSACNGTCQTCGLATSLGQCTPVPASKKPRDASQCVATDKSTCGLDGTCDGAGKCRTYESGTVCRPGTCDNGAVTGTYTCDGAGKCKLGASTVCAPYSCNGNTNLCFTTCSSDANCTANRKCVNGSCGPKMLGASCKQDGECASSHCVKANATDTDGVCCNTACAGACRVCNLLERPGICSPVPAGQGHALCVMEAANTCGTTGICDGFGTCLMYPSGSPCGAATCAAATSVSAARSCDGLGTCQAAEVRDCGNYRCNNGACNTRCTTTAECAPGIACENGSCGTRVDGQPCTTDNDCQNKHCVNDGPGTPGICCNTTCTGPCKSCSLVGMEGRCTNVAAGAADPRKTCTDLTAAMCNTDGKCDGAGACRRYPSGTPCAGETCVNDVYTGQSTCNASGQCVKPTAMPCRPYHCNANKCFSACTTNAECIAPFMCGEKMANSCGLKPLGAACSSGPECESAICAQGVCCSTACDAACTACNLTASAGTCTNVASGPDPQGKCATQPMSSCGTTGQCAAGQCARYPAGSQCAAGACPTTSTRTPPGTCNGTGMCVVPAVANCAPGRCDTATLTCMNTCTTNAQCTAPAICIGGSCGLQGPGGSCTATSQCMGGLTCYLDEGTPGVCCTSTCNGTCESCRNSTGTCTAIAAGMPDPDPATACVAAAPTSCGLSGRCAGNNTAANGAGSARCQFFGTSQGCRSRSCTPGNATTPAMEMAAVTCDGNGTCPPAAVTSCGLYNKCDATNPFQCATTCASNADCVGVPCNTITSTCGTKRAKGQTCTITSDCDTGLSCADGVCCDRACNGPCEACNNTTNGRTLGTCSAVDVGTSEAMCAPTVPAPANICMQTTGLCAAGGVCAKVGNSESCDDGVACTHTDRCNGNGVCAGTAITCTSDTCNTRACNGTASCAVTFTTAPCSDGNACTTGDVCSAGACTPGTPILTCPGADQCHSVGACVPATGCPPPTALPPTTSCDDNNACTTNDTCGPTATCAGTTITCSGADECNTVACVPATGCQAPAPRPDNTACTDIDNNECTSGLCLSGTCTPSATPRDGMPCGTGDAGAMMCAAGVCQ